MRPLFPALRPWLLSAWTGLLLVLCFPKFDIEFLSWVALLPLLVALQRLPRAGALGRAFALGYLAGFVFFAGTHYWVRHVMVNYGHLGALTSAGIFLAFAALLAVYFGLFGAVTWLLLRLPDRLALWAVPAAWVGIELLRAHALTGLPFLLFGYALADHLLIAQLARFGGVYLLSFLLALFNTGILLLARKPARRRGMALAVSLFALAALSLGGSLLPVPRAPRAAYLVQANASLDEDWTPEATDKLVAELSARLQAGFARNESRPGLVVWPEIPASLYYDSDALLRARLGYLARQTGSSLLINTIAFADAARHKPLNSALLVLPSGEPGGRYDKIHLVPFGEYVPYEPVFFFAGKLTAEVGEFVPGEHPVVLGRPPLAALICYEGIFPDLVRRFTAAGAQVLVNISNDAWYGKSAARDQLLLMARLRAVENGRWLLRATNTGITAVVDPYGRVQTFPPGQRAVYAVNFNTLSGRTPYVAFGHWFPVFAAAAGAVGLWRAARTRQ